MLLAPPGLKMDYGRMRILDKYICSGVFLPWLDLLRIPQIAVREKFFDYLRYTQHVELIEDFRRNVS